MNVNDSPKPATNPPATGRNGTVTAAPGGDMEYQSVTGMASAAPDKEAQDDSDESTTPQADRSRQGSPAEPRDSSGTLAEIADSNDTPGAAEPGTDASRSNQPNSRLDPTRYGDWEKNGRCIDF